jgi:putative transposase
MANTYHQVYIQAVFAVKYREAVIAETWQTDLFAVIGNLINETGCRTIIVNGVADHVHCFLGLKPTVSMAEVMKNAKAKSSKWVNESGLTAVPFAWQEGYGVFSYSQSQVHQVYRYIQNQALHHQTQLFREEYLTLLTRFEVPYDERYTFTELI